MVGYSRIVFLFFLMLCTNSAKSQNYVIPEKQIILNEIYPQIRGEHDIKIKVPAFEMSRQVTLKEYKVFLLEMKKDSGNKVYQSLLPDTSIANLKVREEYFHSGKYDDFPVVGISWDNALRYCYWMTKKNNHDSLKTIYRLPNLYEYYSAFIYLQSSAIDNDLNQTYADWLMDAKDESMLEFQEDVSLAYYYFHLLSDPPALKRKVVIGKSFLHFFNSFSDYIKLSYYADHGYREVGFRYIVEKDSNAFLLDETKEKYENPLLKFWNVYPGKI